MTESAEQVQQAGRAVLLETIADLFLCELEEPLVERLRADPTLERLLRPPEDNAALMVLRADYARLFLLDVLPYASIYLDVPPVIGGEAARRWQALLGAGRRPLTTFERAAAPDHAGLVLRALAQVERDGEVDPVLAAALCWLPQYLTALRFNDPAGFYGRVGELATFALKECARRTRPPAASDGSDRTPAPAATAPSLPEEDTLRTIVAWLCTPAQSGWYLSKPQLRRLGQSLSVATGVTDRTSMLMHLFEATGLDGRSSELLETLRAEHERWAVAGVRWGTRLASWSPVLQPWHARLGATGMLLTTLQTTLQ